MNLLRSVVARPGFWLLAIIFVLITIPHYGEAFEHPAFLTNLIENLGLDRHAIERILYLAPIIWAGFLFGRRGAVLASLVALGCMLPRAIFISPHPSDALFETSAVFVVGNLVAFMFHSLQKERERRVQLDALNQVSGVSSQSLDLGQVLGGSIDRVVGVMRVDAALLFLYDEKGGELSLAAHWGVSREFIRSVGKIGLGEGLNGKVALSGEALLVADASAEPGPASMAVSDEGLRSQVIVPMKSKGKVMGTLSVAMRSRRRFTADEVDLLTAIGNQIGVAVENAHLYREEQQIAERLRASEERYRELFENAIDAIWVHDLNGNIIAANRASEGLTGHTLAELVEAHSVDVKIFLSDEGVALAREIGRKLLEGEPFVQPYEQRIIRKDGTEAILMMTTNLVMENGRPVAFQNIARDVTEEKRMKENLQFYLGQITQAQEEERKRIARELHDDTIQSLVVLSRQLDDLSNDSELSDDRRAVLENLWQQTDNVMKGVRRLSQDLRPPTLDRLGLVAAIDSVASDMAKQAGINVEVKTVGTERRLPPEVELLLFRVAQEALRNVWRHSEAASAEILVEFQERRIGITIKDNGKGFDLPSAMGDLVKEGRLGLAGIQERIQLLSGTLRVNSEPGKGTVVTIEAPV